MHTPYPLGDVEIGPDGVGGRLEVSDRVVHRERLAAIVEPLQVATECQDDVAIAMTFGQVVGKMAEFAQVQLVTFEANIINNQIQIEFYSDLKIIT